MNLHSAATRLSKIRLVGLLAPLLALSCGTSKPAAPGEKGTGGASGTGGANASGGAPGAGGQAQPATGGTSPGTGGAATGGAGDTNLDAAATEAGAVDLPIDGGPDGADTGQTDSSPAISACPVGLAALDVRVCVLGADGKLVTTGSEAMVTVTAVDDAMTACDTSGHTPASALFRRLAVESATGTKWTVLLRIPELPATQVSVGQALQMTVTASPTPAFARTAVNQTVVFARQGNLVLFGSNIEKVAAYVGAPVVPWPPPTTSFELLPDLSPWGLTLSDGGLVCTTNVITCLIATHRVNVSWAGAGGTVEPRQTVALGSLSLSLGNFDQYLSQGSCDGNSRTRLGGFVANP